MEPVEDYPRTEADFGKRFGSEEACRDYLFRMRWPEGFRCPRCREAKAWRLRSALWQCASCGYQASLTAGTIFQDTRTPLRVWFRALWWMTSQKNGVSALGLQRVLGLGSYQTAWCWMHKLRRAMVRPGRDRLSGTVEVDEAYVGAPEEGMRGRKTQTKALVVVAAQEDGLGIGRIRMRRHCRRFGRESDALRRGVDPTWQRCAYGWLVGLRPAREQRLPTSDHGPARPTQPFRIAAASSSSNLVVEALASRYSPRSSQSGTSGLLSRRIHLPLQPSEIEEPREALLPPCAASNGRGAKHLQVDRQLGQDISRS